MQEYQWLIAACVAFVGSHFLLSHPLRQSLVHRWGEGPFLGFYSLVAFATLGAMVWAYRAADPGVAFWEVGDLLWGLATFLMLLASILFVGSLIRNPALPGNSGTQGRARGVYGITRHPMMWSFAIWGGSHILVYPTMPNIITCGTIIFLALVGANLQDRKKARLDPIGWKTWQMKTSFFPYAAVDRGRVKMRDARPGFLVILTGTLVWLAATWAHLPLAGWAAGIWRWVDVHQLPIDKLHF